MTSRDHGFQPNAQMNITPFIDVLLVLLIIYMLVAMLKAKLEFQLAQERGTWSAAAPLVVELPGEGGYRFDGQALTGVQLGLRLRALLDARGQAPLFVKAAPSREYREVITAMDIARGAGARVIGLAP